MWCYFFFYCYYYFDDRVREVVFDIRYAYTKHMLMADADGERFKIFCSRLYAEEEKTQPNRKYLFFRSWRKVEEFCNR